MCDLSTHIRGLSSGHWSAFFSARWPFWFASLERLLFHLISDYQAFHERTLQQSWLLRWSSYFFWIFFVMARDAWAPDCLECAAILSQNLPEWKESKGPKSCLTFQTIVAMMINFNLFETFRSFASKIYIRYLYFHVFELSDRQSFLLADIQ